VNEQAEQLVATWQLSHGTNWCYH